MKEVVKENGYQKNIFKIIKRIINNHSLWQTQAIDT